VGCVPISPPYPKPYRDRVLVVGTAARLVLAEGGEGIVYAVRSGVEAAKILKQAFQRNDFSAQFLSLYRKRLESIYQTLSMSYYNLIKKFPAPVRKIFKLEK